MHINLNILGETVGAKFLCVRRHAHTEHQYNQFYILSIEEKVHQ